MLKTLEKLLVQNDLSEEESKLAMQEIFAGGQSLPSRVISHVDAIKRGDGGRAVWDYRGDERANGPCSREEPRPRYRRHRRRRSADAQYLDGVRHSCRQLRRENGKTRQSSVSSLCGSADVLEALGVNILAPKESLGRSIEELGIAFFFAPEFHPALKQLREVRKGLGTRTLFNIIAPFLNPATPEHFMIGVYSKELLDIAAAVLSRLNTRRSLVFHGSGLDELSCVGVAQAMEVQGEKLTPILSTPEELGLTLCSIEDLKGKDAKYNAEKIREAFDGKESPFAELSP